MNDKLDDVHRRMGYTIADLQNGIQAAKRLASEFGDDTPGSPAQTLRWTLEKTEQDVETINAVHNDFDFALMRRRRTPANDAT